MGIYRKKPVEVEARIFPDDGPSQCEIADWVSINGSQLALYDGLVEKNVKTSTEAKWRWRSGSIKTLEGSLQVNIGDWIIKGIKGEFYPCKPDIFDLTYEPTTPAAE